MNFIAAIPTIIALIKAIEAAIPGSGQGAAKLNAFLDIITSLYAELAPHTAELTAIAGAIVKLLNSTGTFTKA